MANNTQKFTNTDGNCEDRDHNVVTNQSVIHSNNVETPNNIITMDALQAIMQQITQLGNTLESKIESQGSTLESKIGSQGSTLE